MRSQGYPKAGNWVAGEFAAPGWSVWLAGTPPKNPAIASNWRNWGSPVEGAPQAGDVAVRRGVCTGSTGSHVTFVEGFDPKTGRFTGVGGNQGGRPEASFRANEYEFRRGGMPNGQTAGPGGGAGRLAQRRPPLTMPTAHQPHQRWRCQRRDQVDRWHCRNGRGALEGHRRHREQPEPIEQRANKPIGSTRACSRSARAARIPNGLAEAKAVPTIRKPMPRLQRSSLPTTTHGSRASTVAIRRRPKPT